MIINAQSIDLAFRDYKTFYTSAFDAAPVNYDKIAMLPPILRQVLAPDSVRNEAYGWLGQFPQLREWLDGERVVKDLSAHGFTPKTGAENRKFESTISAGRDDFSDDRHVGA